MNSYRLSVRLLPLLLCSGLLAQGAAPTHKPSFVEVDYSLGSGDFDRIEFLLPPYHPSHQRDAFVLRGGVVGHVHGIGTHNFIEPLTFPVAVTVADIARIADGNPVTAGHDALLVSNVDSQELIRVHWLDFDDQQSVTFSMPGWQAASEMTVATTANGYEISAIAQDRQTLLRGAGGPGGIAAVSAHWVGSTVRSTALGDEDGDGELETLALTDNGVVIVNRNGTFRSNLPWSHGGGSLTRAGSKVYWLRRNLPDTRWELTVVAGADPIVDPPDITLPGADFALSSVVATDVDQNGEADLLVGQSSTLQAIQVRVTDASPGVLEVEQYYVALAAQLPLQGGTTGPVASADLDGDGYSDVIAARDSTSSLVLVRGTAHGRVYLGPVGDLPPLLYAKSVFADPQHAEPGLHLHFSHSNLFDLSNPDYTHVQVNVWVQNSSSAELAGESQLNREYEIVEWSGSGTPLAHSVYIPSGTVPHTVFHSAGAFWHLEVVFGNGEDTPPGDGLIFTVAGFSDTAAAPEDYFDEGYGHLDSLYPNGDSPAPVFLAKRGGSSPPPAGREKTGGYRPTGGVMPPVVKPSRFGPSQGVTQPTQNQ